MAISGGIPVQHNDVFPHGAFVIGEVIPVNDFDKSTKETKVQQIDKDSGLRLWAVPVMDADPEARKGQRELTVKIAADVQPVPPEAIPGLPFRPVEFDGLKVIPYVDSNGKFAKQGLSFKATGMHKPTGQPAAKSAAKDAA